MIYPSNTKLAVKVPGFHDPDSIVKFDVVFRPPTWQPSTVYLGVGSSGSSVVMPTEYKGFYHRCTNPGKSGSVEPDWARVLGGVTNDFEAGYTSGLTWVAVANNLLPPSVDIEPPIIYSATNGVLVSGTETTGVATVTIDAIPVGAVARTARVFKFTLSVTFSDGTKDDYTFERRVSEK